MSEQLTYLGKSVFYPVTLVGGSPVIATGAQVIEGSIIKILTTPQGSRFFLPEFGTKIYTMLFEPNDQVSQRQLKFYILDCLNTWETRAKFFDVNLLSGADVVLCTILYQILPKNEILSFVFPFYQAGLKL